MNVRCNASGFLRTFPKHVGRLLQRAAFDHALDSSGNERRHLEPSGLPGDDAPEARHNV